MKEKSGLINTLISALNGEAWEDVDAIMNKIIATGDKELINRAKHLKSVI